MLIIGLTGSVASGKNFVADQFKKFNIPIFDADITTHDLIENNAEIFQKIKSFFPQVIIDGKINRQKLSYEVFRNRKKLAILENIIHPVVRIREGEFLKRSRARGAKMIILNIPLLFERGGQKRCHKTIAVITPRLIQKQRFLNRSKNKKPELTTYEIEEKFSYICQNQINNHAKKKLANFIIYNGLDKAFTIRQIRKIYNLLNK